MAVRVAADPICMPVGFHVGMVDCRVLDGKEGEWIIDRDGVIDVELAKLSESGFEWSIEVGHVSRVCHLRVQRRRPESLTCPGYGVCSSATRDRFPIHLARSWVGARISNMMRSSWGTWSTLASSGPITCAVSKVPTCYLYHGLRARAQGEEFGRN